MSLVEYHDPDGIFPLLVPSLSSRLPLKNLHWKLPFRPLRSIDSLHVDFVPSRATSSAQNVKPAGGAVDIVDAEGSRVNGRRHQIPGLRSTPFLKVYLLRCDDKDVYKASKRNLVRDWVKENTKGSQSGSSISKQENHDAHEWLILHVVIPGTVAASQPRFSKRTSGDSEQLKERSSGAKWPGRGPRPILEKLRADFDEPSKHATDRVAQIRLRKEDLPLTFQVPAPAIPLAPIAETSQEQESAWNDLISKLKTMILSSFDRRVTQYEDDVREKDAQRQMPGWNFCTFFVLKEGLAMAFESVGLLEDALAGYDELALGLENSIRNKNGQNENGEATTFLDVTPELQQYLSPHNAFSPSDTYQRREPPLVKSLTKFSQQYRELIASNQISVFNFQRYIFSRQMTLLLLLAGVRPAPNDGVFKNHSTPIRLDDGGRTAAEENPQYLAELGQRAMQFITLTARIMKSDIHLGAASASQDVTRNEFMASIMVSSWIYAVAQEILDASLGLSIPRLPTLTEPRRKKSLGRPELPVKRRSSSQTNQQNKALSSINERQGEESQTVALSLEGVRALENHALAYACAQRAELCLLQRRVMSRLAESLELEVKHRSRNGHKGAYDGEEEEEEEDQFEPCQDEQSNGLISLVAKFNERLAQSLSSLGDNRRLYEALSEMSAWYYLLAGRTKSADRIIADLAIIKFEQGDFAAAASYFNKVLATFGENQWSLAEEALLHKYAQCLKALNRKDEYVRIVLTLLARMADVKKPQTRKRSRNDSAGISVSHTSTSQSRPVLNGSALFEDLVTYSRSLPYDISVPLNNYFDDLEIDRCIHNFDDRDGFELSFSLRQLLASEITIDTVKARLTSTKEGQSDELWLSNNGGETLGDNPTRIKLSTTITVSGRYVVDRIVLHAGKLLFTYEPLAKPDPTASLGLATTTNGSNSILTKAPWVLCYPRPNAFAVRIIPSPRMRFGGARSITIELRAGANEVDSADIILRPGSAGLRLFTAEAEAVFGSISHWDSTKSAAIHVGQMSAHTLTKILVPYTTDTSLSNISIRLEVQYFVENTSYTSLQTCVIPNDLLMGVTVEDMFHKKHLVSKFLLTPASSVPLRVIGASLAAPVHLTVRPGSLNFAPMIASREQSGSIAFRVDRTARPSASSAGPSSKKMSLTLDYLALDDEIVSCVASIFLADLKAGNFLALSELLLESLVTKLKTYLCPADYETIALTAQICLPTAGAFAWGDVLEGVPTDVSTELRTWLEAWHAEHPSMELDVYKGNKSDDTPINQLIIDFDIPRLDYLFTASFQLSESADKTASPPLATLGEAIAGKVVISHTTGWASPPRESQTSGPSEDLIYEVHADPQLWLICGPRRGRFSAKEDEISAFDVTLIPLRTGLLLLPVVEVRPADPDAGKTSETNCTSKCQALMVTENVQSTTVGLGNGSQLQPGVKLLEAERRSLI